MPVMRNPESVSPPVGGYSHGLEITPGSRYLFISGQIPEGANGYVPNDFESQCKMVWKNIEEILKSSGMTFQNLIKITTYLTHPDQAEKNVEIRRRLIGNHRPALTVVVVQTLHSKWLLEIEAIAAVENE